MLPQSAIDIVTSNTIAQLVTITPDCAPRVTAAWTGVDENAYKKSHPPGNTRNRLLSASPLENRCMRTFVGLACSRG
jgi:hypothetical protein